MSHLVEFATLPNGARVRWNGKEYVKLDDAFGRRAGNKNRRLLGGRTLVEPVAGDPTVEPPAGSGDAGQVIEQAETPWPPTDPVPAVTGNGKLEDWLRRHGPGLSMWPSADADPDDPRRTVGARYDRPGVSEELPLAEACHPEVADMLLKELKFQFAHLDA